MNDVDMIIVREYAKGVIREHDRTDRITIEQIEAGNLRVIRNILAFRRDNLREKAQAEKNEQEREYIMTRVGSVKSVIDALDRVLEGA